MKPVHVMILTGEPSGDIHASKLVRVLKKKMPDAYLSGIGGEALKRENVDLFYDIRHLSAMGITEVLLQFNRIRHAFSLFKSRLSTRPPDLLILVDYPGFNLRAAQYAKTHFNFPILYYIAPKVWAWNRSRLKKMKRFTDHVALILPFEEKLYRNAGIRATYVGNPLMDDYPETETKPFLSAVPPLKKDSPELTIGLLPGSRNAEIINLLPVLLRSAQMLANHLPDTRFIVSKASSADDTLFDTIMEQFEGTVVFHIQEGPVKPIFEKADLLVAASGTVTLEAALACVPTILVYKMSELTYRLARFLVNLKFAGLANLIADDEVMPELLQHEATAGAICENVLKMKQNLYFYQQRLQTVRKIVGEKGASRRVATIGIQMLTSQDCYHKN